MKKALSAILAALIAASMFTACGTEKPSVASDVSDTPAAATPEQPARDAKEEKEVPEPLPPAVDLRNYNGRNYVTPVKRQAYGDCWAFGNAAAAESSYLYLNDLGVAAGEDNKNVNFSERYLSWYTFNSITEDDVMPGKVRASQIGEGYDPSEAMSKNPSMIFMLGGALYSGSVMFASGFGPVDETIEKDGENPYAYSADNILNSDDYDEYERGGDWSIPLNAEYRSAPISALLRNGNLLPPLYSKDENGNDVYNEDSVTAIKTEIANGRAVGAVALVFGRMNRDNWATYNIEETDNHVITIVGYDDGFSKDKFAVTGDDGSIEEDSIPPTDGAFLIKDSSGDYGGYDGHGYFYISYHDHSLRDMISFEFDKNDSVRYTDLNYDQYDLLFTGNCAYSDYTSEAKMANVFDAEEDESLYQITYRTKQPNTAVHYEIYKAPKDGAPDSGKLLEEGDSAHYLGGSHKIDLNGQYELKKGEKYSVVLTMTYTDADGKTVYTDVIPYAVDRPMGAKATAVVNKGESYLFSGGKWLDMTEVRNGLAQRAYEQNTSDNIADDFKAKTIDNVAVDNYPIKAILIPG